MNLRTEWFQEELRKSEESLSHRPLEEEDSFYQKAGKRRGLFINDIKLASEITS